MAKLLWRRVSPRVKRLLYVFALCCLVFTGYVFIGNSVMYEEPSGLPDQVTQITAKEKIFDPKDYTSCPSPIDIYEERNVTHHKLQIRCGVGKAELFTDFSSDAKVLSINSGEPCLYNAINNYCPSDGYKVPNLAHYIWFNIKTMSFYHFLSFMSVHLFQAPCVILVHGHLPGGPYWRYLVRVVPNIIHVATNPPSTFNGKSIVSMEHKSDLVRLFVLKEYGGIYFDIDSVLLRSLDSIRNHSVTMSLEYWSNLSNGLILAEPDAKFTRMWISKYREYTYDPEFYFEYSLFVPTKIARLHPKWIHVEHMTFCSPNGENRNQIFEGNYDWGKNFALHLYIRFYKKEHSCADVRKLNTTIGAVARFVIYGTRKLCLD
ncbi:hypothetical protein KP79_PYT04486 [Mizuhopecten yessoensis]|uniref:Alpha-1,4-N-acetylglucosaminyltransferase n=1 Tax=Mizuhopecten yessoensis TaxID=6573 RepID=A0A210PVW0_MIZYE|nr:hypothetical protein KP79_PYT04486 [Mizuhopecten yessoensis]